jgi:hypothetical protein
LYDTSKSRKANVYEETCGSKKVSFRRAKHTLLCEFAGHLSWTVSEVTCRYEERHENVEGGGNIDSSASGDLLISV